ncbi:MAG: Dna2/Cas4 domain-containing protein [Sarcina sp.]
MEFNFENLKVQGVKFNYYFICKRKLWLFSNGITMEENSERVTLGKLIHENSYKKKGNNKEKLIDNMIKLDILDKKNISEVKITSKMEESDRYQLLYYLYYSNFTKRKF